MVKLYNQISLSDTFQECKTVYQNDKPKFLELLSNNLDLSSLIPQTFYWSYNKTLGRDRKYSLNSMVAALIFQKILGIPKVSHATLFSFQSPVYNYVIFLHLTYLVILQIPNIIKT